MMQHRLANDTLSVMINAAGAEPCSIKNKSGTEFIWQANPQVWARHAPVLFPVVGKLKDNLYFFESNSYALSQHGFARDMAFELKENDAVSCTFELRSTADTKKAYPFDFIFRISYALQENTLTTTYTVVNPSGKKLLFSVGAHPGFNCPVLPGERTEDYYLEFERSEYDLTELSQGLLAVTKQKLSLTNNRLFLSPTLFEKDALVFENSQINSIRLCSTVSGPKISMACKNWPYFGIWSKPGQPFVCLEPWYGIADTAHSSQQFSEKKGLRTLEAGQTFSCHFTITIE